MKLSRRFWLAGALSATVIAAGATTMITREDDPPKSGGVQNHITTESPEDVEKYWTRERMEQAEPAPMPVDP